MSNEKSSKYWKLCRECKSKQFYSRIYERDLAIKNNSLCKPCALSIVNLNRDISGENNPFYGKRHSAETNEKIRQANIGRIDTDATRRKKSEASTGARNSMSGRTFYEVWLEKYGQEAADQKLLEYKIKKSEANAGSRNPMYGRPSPQGSGNGWSGWFNDHYFRSLGELRCLLDFEINDEEWVSGEVLRIPYEDWEGNSRTYSPDFITNTEVIECKPSKLHKAPGVLSKAKAGKEWATAHGLSYRITDPGKPSVKTVTDLLRDGKLKFNKAYENKWSEFAARNPDL